MLHLNEERLQWFSRENIFRNVISPNTVAADLPKQFNQLLTTN